MTEAELVEETTTDNRATTPEIVENMKLINRHFDRQYANAIIEKLGNICHETYFRSRHIGFDRMPERNNPQRPLIFISNHSGMAFPWDAMVYASIYNHSREFNQDAFRVLVAPILSESALMNPYMIRDLWKKTGGVDATFLNFETLMHQQEHHIAMYPEGIPGIGKGFNRKYQLQRFATSYVRLAVKYRTDVVWVSTINGEYINPYSYSIGWLNNLVSKIGIPFLPLSLILVFLILQPWVFYFAFPAKLFYVMGPRFSPWRMTSKTFEEMTDDDFEAISKQIRDKAQEHINKSVKEYGRSPFMWREWWSKLIENKKYFPFYLPIVWPLIYTDFDKQYQHNVGVDFETDLSWGGFWRMLWRNPIYLAYFIPILGSIPLLIKGYSGNNINANEARRRTQAYQRMQNE